MKLSKFYNEILAGESTHSLSHSVTHSPDWWWRRWRSLQHRLVWPASGTWTWKWDPATSWRRGVSKLTFIQMHCVAEAFVLSGTRERIFNTCLNSVDVQSVKQQPHSAGAWPWTWRAGTSFYHWCCGRLEKPWSRVRGSRDRHRSLQRWWRPSEATAVKE